MNLTRSHGDLFLANKAEEEEMAIKTDWADRPLWVRVALFGIPSRRAAKTWMVLDLVGTIVFALASIAALLFLGSHLGPAIIALGAAVILSLVLLGLGAALWYWLAIQYADDHAAW